MAALPMADQVHLCVEAGCGGTSWGLQLAREALARGAHVCWVCSEIPDGARFGQLFAEVSPAAVSRMHIAAVGENLTQGALSAVGLIESLGNLGLVVLDDWAPHAGQVPKASVDAVLRVAESARTAEVPLLIISAAFEDADPTSTPDGCPEGWRGRKMSALGDAGFTHWFLLRHSKGIARRVLHQGDAVLDFTLEESGFTHSS